MHSLTKNLLAATASLMMIFAPIVAVVWYFDDRFGEGTGGVIALFLAGVLIAFAIVAGTMVLMNRTHQAAGEDLVEHSRNEAKTKAQVWGMMRDDARAQNARLAASEREISQRAGMLAKMQEKALRAELEAKYGHALDEREQARIEREIERERQNHGLFDDDGDDVFVVS